MSAPYCVVVDAYSSGNQLAPPLAARGYEAVHARSIDRPSAALLATYFPGHFVEDRFVGGDPAAYAAALAARRGGPPAAVFVGTETGAAVADALAAAFGVAGNDPATSPRRRDKFVMIEALHAAGVRAARQAKAGRVGELLAWRRDLGLTDVVVKPVASAGADNVRRCRTEGEVRDAAAAIFGGTNQMGGEDREVLIQEFLAGPEYYVNTVSCAGRHQVCEVWAYTKTSLHGRDFVYDRNDLLADGAAEPAAALGAYVARVLDALGFVVGPAHAEVLMTPDGPALVEIGPRLQGMAAFGANGRGIGYSPLDLTLDAALDPAAFAARTGRPYRSGLHARRVFLRSFRAGTLAGYRHEAALRGLESFEFLRWIKSPGDVLKPTVDYFTIPGLLVLAHEDPAVIARDTAAARALEAELFRYEGDP